jgi:hypothetical protein
MLNQKALHQLATVNPFTIKADHLIMIILMISRKKPKVKIVIGMVSMISIGLTKAFNKASTNASKTAEVPLMIVTPGMKCAAIKAANAVTSILPINFPTIVFLFVYLAVIPPQAHKTLPEQNIC